MNRVAIFSAGTNGTLLLKKYKKEDVCCFIDNDAGKQGSSIHGIPIISLDTFMKRKTNAKVIIPTFKYLAEIAEQLEANGILDWIFKNPYADPIYPEDILVFNPYGSEDGGLHNENDYNESVKQDRQLRAGQLAYAKRLLRNMELFDHIEIETYNRCNGSCGFCPVSKGNDTREERWMDEELFHKIIEQLASINYSGRFSLFSNNEPFLDERIIDFQKYAREGLPNAKMQLFTNGTLLTLPKFKEIINYLDYLVIDNYNPFLKLNATSAIIRDYCEKHPELIAKVTIVLRRPQEILTSRGGNAPNRKDLQSYPDASCCLPFKQLIIRPDGKVSLCCNDPLGLMTLGDVSEDSLQDIWYGESFQNVRDLLLKGRKTLDHCRYCDTFYYF